MSDWKVGDFVQTKGWEDKVIFRITSDRSPSVLWALKVVWSSVASKRRGDTYNCHVSCLRLPNEMKILALVADGDLDV